jgi:hypothetical protein
MSAFMQSVLAECSAECQHFVWRNAEFNYSRVMSNECIMQAVHK